MRNIIIGLILGFALTLPLQAKAYAPVYTDWQNEVVDLLEQLIDGSDEISDKLETMIDKL